MAPKFLWILLPLLLYATCLAVASLRGRLPSRRAINIHTSILLIFYLLGTAGLGLFWVANQQLPVFDWHYLFGYATLLLVVVHLSFNLPVVFGWLRRRGKEGAQRRSGPETSTRAPAPGLRRPAVLTATAVAALAAGYLIGTRHGAAPTAQLSSAGMPGSSAAVLRYHELSSESRSGVFLRAPEIAWGNAPPPFKTYPGRPHVALPAQPQLRPAATQPLAGALRGPATARTLDAATLGQLLYLAAGVTQRGDHAKRAAPSSGALFASELYVAVRRVDDIAPGLYHYDADRHRLIVLGVLGAPPAALGAPQAEDAAALVIASALFRRTAFKYHQRAYRYVAADLGHLLENLRLAAHQAGQRIDLLPQFDELRAAHALGIDGVEEGVMAMAALRNGAAPPRPAHVMPSAAMVVAGNPPGDFSPVSPRPSHPLGATGDIHVAASLAYRTTDGQATIALPMAVLPATGTHDAIIKRRSVRRYAGSAVPLEALSAMLAAMAQPPQLSDALRINVVVNRVQGLAPGVYRYAPGHMLQRVAAGDVAARAQQAALDQQVIGDAAAVLVLSAHRQQVLAQGARGYRHALIEAGLIGERWLLGAVAHGLAACPVGAFYDDEAAALIGRQDEWVLHFAALGRPAP
jgi:SagB-type dehydrogenase family enzyme